ncbi:MAG: signal peptide peptidase SppA [Bacteroidales bacterium]|jgi:protease-4|nr:signal peptide peptidase SppA [Bacteroidales bacterium]
MKEFFRTFLAVILALVVTNVLMFLTTIIILGSLATFQKPKAVVHDNSVLVLDFKEQIVDYASVNNYTIDIVSGSMNVSKSLNLRDVINAIKNAAKDTKIKGISMEITSIPTELSILEEVRKELNAFKESGKFIYAYSNSGYSQKSYYIASVADQVFISPVGEVQFKGLFYMVPYFKDFLDKFNMEVQVVRHGKYKSAVEPYLDNKMSEANREQISSYVNSTWNDILVPISISRNISVANLNNYADNLAIDNAKKAEEYNFIDKIMYEDQYMDLLKEKTSTTGKLARIEMSKYISAHENAQISQSSNSVAIIYAQGEIVEGKSSGEALGNETICKALREAREDKNVRAVVFRVNSPGGSALASEYILREVKLTAEEKPLVVSMGSYAASGGYYISCAADYIFADPTTLTGSIGVFGMIPNFQKAIKKYLAINFESVKTNENANYMTNVFEPMTPFQLSKLQNEIEAFYNTFISHVAEGRGMTKERVDEIGQGRVWTGTEAIKIGLVDELGSLNDAIAFAADKAELTDYRIKEYPQKKEAFVELLEELMASTRIKSWQSSPIAPYVQAMEQVANMEGVQARLPFVLIEE